MICLLRDCWGNNMEYFFIFVEGSDDERFVNSVLKEENVKIIKYAKEKKEYINNYIKSIKSMTNCDYIVICDIDSKSLIQKKNEIVLQFPACEKEKIIVSIAEIESWYIAGVDEATSKLMKIKYIYYTEDITKEKFDQMIPKKMDRINFMIEILKKFNLGEAILRNNSLNIFIDYLVQVKWMAVL